MATLCGDVARQRETPEYTKVAQFYLGREFAAPWPEYTKIAFSPLGQMPYFIYLWPWGGKNAAVPSANNTGRAKVEKESTNETLHCKERNKQTYKGIENMN